MTNLENIEIFLKEIIVSRGKDPNDPQEKICIKLQTLMIVMKDVVKVVGDDKLNDFFRKILTDLVINTPEGPSKENYMDTLAAFNKKLNLHLN